MSRFSTMTIEHEIRRYFKKYKDSRYDLEEKADELRELIDIVLDDIIEEEGLEE